MTSDKWSPNQTGALVTRHFFFWFFVHIVRHCLLLVIEFVILFTQFILYFGLFLASLFFFSFILILRQEATPPLPAGRSSSPPHHWYFFPSLASLSLSLFFRFDLLLWFLSLSHSLISSLAQLLPPLWLSILASVWVVTFVWVSVPFLVLVWGFIYW